MKKLLLIEDDADLFALLKYNLEKEGFSLAGSQTGKGALELCHREGPDLILLDIMLPDCDGLDICKRIRQDARLAATPVIFLTARASETDRIVGLELGANDYLVKPFFVRELIARIRLQLRAHAAAPSPAARVLQAGALELNCGRREARLRGAPLSLTATEFRLLEFLMTHTGMVFSRQQLLDGVWGQDRAITDRVVDVYVLRVDPFRAWLWLHPRAGPRPSRLLTGLTLSCLRLFNPGSAASPLQPDERPRSERRQQAIGRKFTIAILCCAAARFLHSIVIVFSHYSRILNA
jgi:DNA-binding response OmpR family regulator